MFFSTGMLTYLIVTTMLTPVLYNYHHAAVPALHSVDLVTPGLISRILRLEARLRWVPPVAFGAGILAYGSAIFGGRVFRDYVEWRARNPPTYSHINTGAGWNAGSDFLTGGGWSSWVHDLYERASQSGTVRGHRTIDFLAFALNKRRHRFRGRLEAAFKSAYEYFAAEPHDVVGAGWSTSDPAEVVEVGHEEPVVVSEPASAYSPYSHSYGVGHGHGYDEYHGPSFYEPHGDYGPEKYYASPEEAGHTYLAHSSGPRGTGHVYGGKVRSSRMSAAQQRRPEYTPEPLSVQEFKNLIEWASSSNKNYLAYDSKGQSSNFDTMSSSELVLIPMPSNPTKRPPKVVRIKRANNNNKRYKSTTSSVKPPNANDNNIMGQLIEDVGTFFSVIQDLDENKCLQKFICHVHVRVKELLLPDAQGKELTRPAQSTTNQVLDTFMPDTDVNYKNYKSAVLLGTKSNSTDTCTRHYSSCKYSALDIIGFNNALTEADNEDGDEIKKSSTTTTTTTAMPITSTTSSRSTTTTSSKKKKSSSKNKNRKSKKSRNNYNSDNNNSTSSP